MKQVANYKNWKNKLSTIENPGLNLSVQSLRDNSYENYVFDDLQFFVNYHIPYTITPDAVVREIERYPKDITTDEAITAWCEHDAIHYLSQQAFSKDGERCVKYLEQLFHRGWLPYGEDHNPWKPVECKYSHINQELITETAEVIKLLLDT